VSDVRFEQRRASLNQELERLEDELAATPLEERQPIADEIGRVEAELRDLAVDQRNRSSMAGGSEA
jgi:uncharacterized small protein (DUF1192 family)